MELQEELFNVKDVFTSVNAEDAHVYIGKQVYVGNSLRKVGLIGTNGNMIGDKSLHTEHTTPESRELHELFRAMADEGCTHVVMEVSSHSLAMERVIIWISTARWRITPLKSVSCSTSAEKPV